MVHLLRNVTGIYNDFIVTLEVVNIRVIANNYARNANTCHFLRKRDRQATALWMQLKVALCS